MQILKIFLTILLFSATLWADWDIRYHNANQWELAISNFGMFGHSELDAAGGFWPIGSGHIYIFGAGIDVGGVKPNGDTVVTIGYGPGHGACEYTPGIPYSNPLNHEWRIYLSTDFDYPFPSVSWQDGFAIYNDFDPAYHIPDSFFILGVTITQKTYVWPIDWSDDLIFFKYIIKNDTTYTVDDIYVSVPIDFDIGYNFTNDRCGLDLSRKLFYGWQEEMEPGSPAWRPGMLGFKLLSHYPLSSYRRFTHDYHPGKDREYYLTMAGYNYQTGLYEPYDTIWPPPEDQIVMLSTGPFDSLAPGDSIVVDWVLIASPDTIPPAPDLENKADKAQACYEAGWHNAHVTDPNGGEIVSGNYDVAYTATSVTSNPLLINFYLQSLNNINTIATDQINTGTFNWNSALWPDGVFYKIAMIPHDTITYGYDISDDFFTIDNPGNAPPGIMIFSPVKSETLSGDCYITWFARDPEFQDSLLINIYFKSQYDPIFHIVTRNEPNDSVYTWNTVSHRNGTGLLVVEARDEEFSASETVQVCLLNHIAGGDMDHVNGLNNTVALSVLIHEPQNITGHTYELRFLEYRALENRSYYPEYMYEIVDSNTGIAVLDTYSLKNGYTFYDMGISINDYSPITDGFSIWAYTEDTDIISYTNFRNDSIQVATGTYPQDSVALLGTHFRVWWAYRGSRLQIDWVQKATGGLTLLVTDLDYGDTIPYKPYGFSLNPDSASGWCFHAHFLGMDEPSDTLRDDDKYIFVCGDRLQFSRSIPAPQVGDRWIVYHSQYSPPIKGNVYRFTPTVGINEHKDQLLPICLQVYPVPSMKNLTIVYSVPQAQKINLTIYDVLGRKIRKLRDGLEKSGQYTIFWNGMDDRNRKVSAGVYFCRFETENHKDTKKFIMLK